MFARFGTMFTFLAVFALCLPPPAAHAFDGFGDVRLQARVCDRQGLPVPGVRLQFRVRLDGQAKQADGSAFPLVDTRVLEALTDAGGTATVRVETLAHTTKQWFHGTVRADVAPAPKGPEVTPVSDAPLHIDQTVPAVRESGFALDVPTLVIFDLPTRMVDGFPVWAARNGSVKKMVVLLEGFDLDNSASATDTMRLIGPVGDVLRQRGVGIMVVNYPDSQVSPDTLAPLVSKAIQTAARLAGGKVAVTGLSMGGLVGRYALCAAEKSGSPLPVHTFLMFDTPNRGATINPGLQAITLRYGTPTDRKGLTSEAARALLQAVPDDIAWKRVGIAPPILGRMVPNKWRDDTHFHDAFMARLLALGKNGYPTTCRVVSVANSSRHSPPVKRGDLLHIWLPGAEWTLRAQPADHAPGSLLPPYYVSRYALIYPFGLAGSYLRSAPTFVACASALDADADETPPFDAWYARPDNLPPLPHNVVDAGAAAFTIGQLLGANWE